MANAEKEINDPNLIIEIWKRVSEETGVKLEMVGHIHQSITKERKGDIHIDSKNASKFILQDLLNNDNGSIKEILKHNGITSSEDFGEVIERLCNEELLRKEENDNYEDFIGEFTTESIDEYMKIQNLKKEHDWYEIGSYFLYVIGFMIVICSYYIGNQKKMIWLGSGIGVIGWLLIRYRRRKG